MLAPTTAAITPPNTKNSRSLVTSRREKTVVYPTESNHR